MKPMAPRCHRDASYAPARTVLLLSFLSCLAWMSVIPGTMASAGAMTTPPAFEVTRTQGITLVPIDIHFGGDSGFVSIRVENSTTMLLKPENLSIAAVCRTQEGECRNDFKPRGLIFPFRAKEFNVPLGPCAGPSGPVTVLLLVEGRVQARCTVDPNGFMAMGRKAFPESSPIAANRGGRRVYRPRPGARGAARRELLNQGTRRAEARDIHSIEARILMRQNLRHLLGLLAGYEKSTIPYSRLVEAAALLLPYSDDLKELLVSMLPHPTMRARTMARLDRLLRLAGELESAGPRSSLAESRFEDRQRIKRRPGSSRGMAMAREMWKSAQGQQDSRRRVRAPGIKGEKSVSASIGGAIKVLPGDSLFGLARKHLGSGSKFRTLAEANGLRPPYLIFPGQMLEIPGGGSSSPLRSAAAETAFEPPETTASAPAATTLSPEEPVSPEVSGSLMRSSEDSGVTAAPDADDAAIFGYLLSPLKREIELIDEPFSALRKNASENAKNSLETPKALEHTPESGL